MQALDLNLATRPFRNNTLLWAGLALALIAIGALTTWNVQTYLESTRGLADLRQRAGDIESRRSDLGRRNDVALQAIGGFDLEPLTVRAQKANEVIRWKAFSWTRLFNLLQDVQPDGVQMATISPVFRTEETGGRSSPEGAGMVPVTVDGIARGLEDFLDFQRDLLSDPNFDRVEPVRTSTDNNSGETVFQLRFYYDPSFVSEAPTGLVAEAGAGAGGADSEEDPEDDPEEAEPLAGSPGEEDVAEDADEILGTADPAANFLATDPPGPEDPSAEAPKEGADKEVLAPTEDEPEPSKPRKRNPRRRGGGRRGENADTAKEDGAAPPPREADEAPDDPGGASFPVEEAR